MERQGKWIGNIQYIDLVFIYNTKVIYYVLYYYIIIYNKKLYTIQSKDYSLKISTDKTKIMVFKGKPLVRSKIEIDGSVLDQVK